MTIIALVNVLKEISNLETNEQIMDYFQSIREWIEGCDNINFWWEFWKKLYLN